MRGTSRLPMLAAVVRCISNRVACCRPVLRGRRQPLHQLLRETDHVAHGRLRAKAMHLVHGHCERTLREAAHTTVVYQCRL